MYLFEFGSELTVINSYILTVIRNLDDYIPVPLANSTAVDDAESTATDNACLRNVLSENFSVLRVGFSCLETTPNFLTSKTRRQ